MRKRKKKFTVLVIVGTRPEIIKMFPVIRSLQACRHITTTILSTDQHHRLISSLFRIFRIRPHIRLHLTPSSPDLSGRTGKSLARFRRVFQRLRPHLVLVQGDTTSALAGALAAYYHRLPVGHVEAGLRTADKYNPFPEEINRRFIDALADLHFAPTRANKQNLIKENIPARSIYITGNTVIDALNTIRAANAPLSRKGLARLLAQGKKAVLVTIHRREHWGAPLQRILSAVKKIAISNPEADILFPVHPNPQIRYPVRQALLEHRNIHLLRPLVYPDFVAVMQQVCLILTDSGGIQEEATTLGIPVLVVREKTERPEAIRSGPACLVGTQVTEIVAAADRLLHKPRSPQPRVSHCFGRGKAAEKITDRILKWFGLPGKHE